MLGRSRHVPVHWHVNIDFFLGEFEKLRNATSSFMSVPPSVRMEQLGAFERILMKSDI